jgi:hypothetical protein
MRFQPCAVAAAAVVASEAKQSRPTKVHCFVASLIAMTA